MTRLTEPPHGSVIMVHGETGTAYQRFYSDGLWHGTTGQVMTWEQISLMRGQPPIVLFRAEEES